MAINQPDWNAVREAVATEGGNALYRRVEKNVTEFDEKTGSESTRKVVSYEPIPQNVSAKASFARIEADVERLVQEVRSLQIAERDLRTALEEPGGAETPRR